MPDESEFICGDWVWDASQREMRHYPRRGKKGHADEPDAVERLQPATKVTLYRWSQQPIQTATGDVMSARQARVQVRYEDGRSLDINEDLRDCAQKIAEAIAGSYGLTVEYAGAPTGQRTGNLPKRDEMGRIRTTSGRTETMLDETVGELSVVRSKRPFGKDRRSLRTSEIRRVELDYSVSDAYETFSVVGIIGADEERIPLASYTGLEGWADSAEWREFTEDLGRRLGVEARLG